MAGTVRLGVAMSVERERVAGFGRLEDGLLQAGEWYRWGPYVSERQWGTVPEDYSADRNAWITCRTIPRGRGPTGGGRTAFAGFCDIQQRLCLALALWNGRDPILKERAFGLTNSQGNHGEDVKECYYYLHATPTSSYVKMLYKYPQSEFPYADLVETNGARGKADPEYELIDTGV